MTLTRGGWLLAAAWLAAASGCESLNPRTVQIDAASGRFQSAQLTYEIDASRLGRAQQPARVEGQQVSYQQPPRQPLPDASHARLSIQYPHPHGKAGYALAEVIIESNAGPAKSDASGEKSGFQKFIGGLTDAMNDVLPGMVYGEGVREAWALDVPKEDLDHLLGHLANSGYFQYGPEPTPGVEMFTRLDGRIIRKTWRNVPQLDAFIERVRQEGRLVSHVPPKSNKSAVPGAAFGGGDGMATYGRPSPAPQAQMGPPPQPYPMGNPPPRSFGPPPQPGPGPMYPPAAASQSGWGQAPSATPQRPMPQPAMSQQQAPPWGPQPNSPAALFEGLPPRQPMAQPSPASAAGYGYPASYGPLPQGAAGQSPPPPGGLTYPNSAQSQAYPQTSQASGPNPDGGAYPYVR